MRPTLPLLASLPILALGACDGGPAPTDGLGGKADDASSERAKNYAGRDFYDIDRFDTDNLGRFCGFERARRGSITSGTRSISLNNVTFPLTTVSATDDRAIKLERLDPERSLFERPIFVADVASDPRDFTITLFVDRLTLEPDVMLISHEGGGVQLCQGLTPEG